MKLAKNHRNHYILFHGDQQLVLKPNDLLTAYKLIRDGIVMENKRTDFIYGKD